MIGARGVLEPGYGGDLPDVGPRSETDVELRPVDFEARRGTGMESEYGSPDWTIRQIGLQGRGAEEGVRRRGPPEMKEE